MSLSSHLTSSDHSGKPMDGPLSLRFLSKYDGCPSIVNHRVVE